MQKLMNHVEFRTALENAIKGKSANKAPFSIAWASGKLSRAHLARWAENHYHYVGPFADYLGYIYARMPERYQEAVGEAEAPLIEITGRTQLSAVAEDALHSIAQQVVDSEIGFPCVRPGEVPVGFGVGTDGTYEELLRSPDKLRATHRFLPEAHLAQPVGAFHPITAALKGVRVFRADT